MMYAVDGVDALEDVLDRVVDRVLAALDGKALVAHVLQGYYLLAHLILSQLLARDGLVLEVIGAVDAAVDAVVGQVQRREDDDAVAVEGELDLLGDLIDPLLHLGVVAGEQDGRLAVRQTVAAAAGGGGDGTRLLQYGVDELHVVFVSLRIGQGLADLSVVDEFVGVHRRRIVDSHKSSPFIICHSEEGDQARRGNLLPLNDGIINKGIAAASSSLAVLGRHIR